MKVVLEIIEFLPQRTVIVELFNSNSILNLSAKIVIDFYELETWSLEDFKIYEKCPLEISSCHDEITYKRFLNKKHFSHLLNWEVWFDFDLELYCYCWGGVRNFDKVFQSVPATANGHSKLSRLMQYQA